MDIWLLVIYGPDFRMQTASRVTLQEGIDRGKQAEARGGYYRLQPLVLDGVPCGNQFETMGG